MNKKIVLTAGAIALVGAATLGLTACSSASTDSASTDTSSQASQVIAPIIVDTADLNGTTVDLPLNNVMDINVPADTEADWTATVADPSILEFTAGGTDGGATMNPGIKPLKAGSTEVTLTNSKTGDTVTFTVNVA